MIAFLLTPLIIFLYQSLVTATTYNVVSLGAKGDGKSDSTKSFLNAWAATCYSTKLTTIYVPWGRFLIIKTIFSGQCNNRAITICIYCTLVAPSDYNVLRNASNWLVFEQVSGVSIHGGTLDGQGTGLWVCKAFGKGCPIGAMIIEVVAFSLVYNLETLEFSNSNNIMISVFHIIINSCNNVKVQGVKVSALHNSQNIDDIHISSSSGITILNSRIATGDDCISIGPGTFNLWIEKIACGLGHGIRLPLWKLPYEEHLPWKVSIRLALTYVQVAPAFLVEACCEKYVPQKLLIAFVICSHVTQTGACLASLNVFAHSSGFLHGLQAVILVLLDSEPCAGTRGL
ncbi:hypothetical protein HYC85_026496 [Camellia sinensis]|uniref:Pectate lyase superfamily protein domain-containing protein n=1 Tax=Camellia sinensis TaxID=4442 RepID=A0A7J7G498_CAMSI|nr:hypothetical protein HYC85_026496 [Camellia sinensis]